MTRAWIFPLLLAALAGCAGAKRCAEPPPGPHPAIFGPPVEIPLPELKEEHFQVDLGHGPLMEFFVSGYESIQYTDTRHGGTFFIRPEVYGGVEHTRLFGFSAHPEWFRARPPDWRYAIYGVPFFFFLCGFVLAGFPREEEAVG